VRFDDVPLRSSALRRATLRELEWSGETFGFPSSMVLLGRADHKYEIS
jgi:hypothetical protein